MHVLNTRSPDSISCFFISIFFVTYYCSISYAVFIIIFSLIPDCFATVSVIGYFWTSCIFIVVSRTSYPQYSDLSHLIPIQSLYALARQISIYFQNTTRNPVFHSEHRCDNLAILKVIFLWYLYVFVVSVLWWSFISNCLSFGLHSDYFERGIVLQLYLDISAYHRVFYGTPILITRGNPTFVSNSRLSSSIISLSFLVTQFRIKEVRV